jgi:hypothetical protein
VKYVLAFLALVVAGVGVYVVTLDSDVEPVSYRVLTVELGDPRQVVVTFEVDKEPSATAECQVTATGAKRDIVNRLTGITIPPAAQRRTVHKVTVPTDQPATEAAVAYCVVAPAR